MPPGIYSIPGVFYCALFWIRGTKNLLVIDLLVLYILLRLAIQIGIKKSRLAINPYTPHERREWIEAQRP
jgi:hypothetical protein